MPLRPVEVTVMGCVLLVVCPAVTVMVASAVGNGASVKLDELTVTVAAPDVEVT